MPQKKSSIAAALERAKSTLTQEVMRKAMSELPLGTPMGVIVGSLRSAGFVKEFEAMTLRDFLASFDREAATGPGGRRAKQQGARKRAARGKPNTRTARGTSKRKISARSGGKRKAPKRTPSRKPAPGKITTQTPRGTGQRLPSALRLQAIQTLQGLIAAGNTDAEAKEQIAQRYQVSQRTARSWLAEVRDSAR